MLIYYYFLTVAEFSNSLMVVKNFYGLPSAILSSYFGYYNVVYLSLLYTFLYSSIYSTNLGITIV